MRKLIGTVVLFIFMGFYALLAMALAVEVLPEAGKLTQFVYYAVAGLAWVLPAGVLVRWMQRPDPVQ